MINTTIPDQSRFSTVLAAMRNHYKSGPSERFDLEAAPGMFALTATPIPSTNAPIAGAETILPILSGIAAEAKKEALASIARQKAGAQAAADQFKRDKDVNRFHAAMGTLCDQAKKDSDANIDGVYASATTVGEGHPDQQNAILSGMNQIMDILNQMIGKLLTIISNLISSVGNIANGAPDVSGEFAPAENAAALL